MQPILKTPYFDIMKNLLKAYFTFNKSERIGLMALLAIIILLATARLTMHHFIKANNNTAKEQQMRAAWQQFKSTNTVDETDNTAAIPAKVKQPNAPVKQHSPQLFPFDPNTIDSTGLRKLGLREKTTTILLHWRAKGKVFRQKEELRKVYTLTEEEYQRLEPYIVIQP